MGVSICNLTAAFLNGRAAEQISLVLIAVCFSSISSHTLPSRPLCLITSWFCDVLMKAIIKNATATIFITKHYLAVKVKAILKHVESQKRPKSLQLYRIHPHSTSGPHGVRQQRLFKAKFATAYKMNTKYAC